jgi:hypothetical protein
MSTLSLLVSCYFLRFRVIVLRVFVSAEAVSLCLAICVRDTCFCVDIQVAAPVSCCHLVFVTSSALNIRLCVSCVCAVGLKVIFANPVYVVHCSSLRLRLTTVGDPPRRPRDTPLSTKAGTKFRRQVPVAQSVKFFRFLPWKLTALICTYRRGNNLSIGPIVAFKSNQK